MFVHKSRHRGECTQHIPRGKRRRYLTHVAFICDDAAIQKILPQFIIGNEVTFPARKMAQLRAAAPPHFTLVRQRSAWNNERLCATIIRRLGTVLGSHTGSLQPILLMDAVRLHTTRLVLSTCEKMRIWPIVVPSKMTWLLQPLDTHAFLPYKRALEDAYQGARELSRNGDPSIECFMPCIYAASRAVLENRSWCDAFNKNGFGLRQRGLRRFIFEQLGTRCCVAPLERPSAEQVTQCFPRGSHAPIEHLWRIFDRDIPLVHASAAPVASEPLGGIVPCELVSIGPPGVSTRSYIVNGSRFTLCRHRSNSIGDAFDDASAARAAAYPQTLPVRQHGSDRLCFCWLHAFMH